MGKLFNRVSVTVASAPGTGVVTLGSASAGKQTFAAAGAVNGDSVSYVIEENTTSWEIGTGTYSSTGPTLTRSSITASSNGGAAVNFGASAIVMCDMLAGDFPVNSGTAGQLAYYAATGTIVSGNSNISLPTGAFTVGYLGIPIIGGGAKTTSYVGVIDDQGMLALMNGSSLSYTIPANASVAYPINTVLTIVNIHSSSLTIAINSDTLYLAGTVITGSRSLTQNGIATALKVASTTWLISGAGLS